MHSGLQHSSDNPSMIWPFQPNCLITLRSKRRVSKAVHITDWYPTLMGLSGCDESLTERLDGDNVLEAISEGKESPRLEILYNIKPLYNCTHWLPAEMIWDLGYSQETKHLSSERHALSFCEFMISCGFDEGFVLTLCWLWSSVHSYSPILFGFLCFLFL